MAQNTADADIQKDRNSLEQSGENVSDGISTERASPVDMPIADDVPSLTEVLDMLNVTHGNQSSENIPQTSGNRYLPFVPQYGNPVSVVTERERSSEIELGLSASTGNSVIYSARPPCGCTVRSKSAASCGQSATINTATPSTSRFPVETTSQYSFVTNTSSMNSNVDAYGLRLANSRKRSHSSPQNITSKRSHLDNANCVVVLSSEDETDSDKHFRGVIQTPVIQKTPIIYIHNKKKWIWLRRQLFNRNIGYCGVKNHHDAICFEVVGTANFHAVKTLLRENGVAFYTSCLSERPSLYAIIRGLPMAFQEHHILKELRSLGHPVMKVEHMTLPSPTPGCPKVLVPLFMVTLWRFHTAIYEVTSLFDLSVTVNPICCKVNAPHCPRYQRSNVESLRRHQPAQQSYFNPVQTTANNAVRSRVRNSQVLRPQPAVQLAMTQMPSRASRNVHRAERHLIEAAESSQAVATINFNITDVLSDEADPATVTNTMTADSNYALIILTLLALNRIDSTMLHQSHRQNQQDGNQH